MLRYALPIALALTLAACDTSAPDTARGTAAASVEVGKPEDQPAPRHRPHARPGPRTAFPAARRLKIRYGPDPTGRQDAEVYVPAGFGPFPIVVLVHGGGFTSGSRAATVPTARMLQAEGIIGVAPSYRLSPPVPAPTDPGRVHHPVHTDDVATVVRWAADNAAALRADPDGIVLLGHSSGTTIATLLAFAPGYLERAGVDRSRIAGVLRLDGHTSDFTTYVPRDQPHDNASIVSIFGDDRARLYPAIVGTDGDGQPIYDVPDPLNLSAWYEVRDGAELPPAFVASGSAPDREYHSGRLHQRLLDGGFSSVLWTTTLDHGRMLGALRTPETAEEALYRDAVLGFIRDVTRD